MPHYMIWPLESIPEGHGLEARDPYTAAKKARETHEELRGVQLIVVPANYVTVTRKPIGDGR